HRHGPTEESSQDGAAAGENSGPTLPGQRFLRSHSGGHARGRTFALGDEKRTKSLARITGRRLHAAYQSPGGFGRAAVVEEPSTAPSGGARSGGEERAFDSAFVPPEGAAGEGPRHGGFSGLCPVGDAEAS